MGLFAYYESRTHVVSWASEKCGIELGVYAGAIGISWAKSGTNINSLNQGTIAGGFHFEEYVHPVPVRWWFELCVLERHNIVYFPLWVPLMLWIGFTAWFVTKNKGSAPAGSCESCGYNLYGNKSGICPECGNDAVAMLAKDVTSLVERKY